MCWRLQGIRALDCPICSKQQEQQPHGSRPRNILAFHALFPLPNRRPPNDWIIIDAFERFGGQPGDALAREVSG